MIFPHIYYERCPTEKNKVIKWRSILITITFYYLLYHITFHLSPVFSFFFLKDFICLFMRETNRDIGRRRSRLREAWYGTERSLIRTSIPGPKDYYLSQRQMLNHWATQVSPNFFSFKLWLLLFFKKYNLFWGRQLKNCITSAESSHIPLKPSSLVLAINILDECGTLVTVENQ